MINQLKELQALASNYKLECVLVGGFVRDKLIFNQESTDIDIEVHPQSIDTDVDTFVDRYLKFCQKLKGKKLPYNIFKVSFKGFEVELSPPRIEVFNDGDLSHDNFEIKISTSRNFKEIWKRRDFTINSIGISLLDDKVIDPFSGIEQGQKKVLKPCGPDFYNDYVRLFRGVRFHLLFGFKFDFQPEKFNLSKVSLFHYIREGLKSNDLISFVKTLTELNVSSDVDLSLKKLNELLNEKKNTSKISTLKALETFIAKSENAEEFLNLIIPYGIVSKKRIQKIRGKLF